MNVSVIGIPLLVGVGVVVAVAPPRRRARAFERGEPGVARQPRRAVVHVAEVLDRAGIDVEVARVPGLWSAALGLAAVVGFALGGGTGVVGAVLLAVVGPPAWVATRGDRRRALVISSLPELLELAARGLRGGADLRTALSESAGAVPGAGQTLRPALDRVAAGARLGEALDRWVVDIDHPDAAIVRAVVRMGDTTGAAMATALDRAAGTLRERAALRAEIAALTSQTRASSMVVASAPLGFLLVITSTDPRSAEVLFTTGWGRLCLVVGLGLDAAGIFWMRRLTTGVGP